MDVKFFPHDMIVSGLGLLFAARHAKSKYDKFETTQFNEYVGLLVCDEATCLIVLLDGVYSYMCGRAKHGSYAASTAVSIAMLQRASQFLLATCRRLACASEVRSSLSMAYLSSRAKLRASTAATRLLSMGT